MKIGIPRGLVYYYFNDLWINFFSYLNIDFIISPKTNKEILELGIKYGTDEMCLSLKTYIGHVKYLENKCDYILVPRLANYNKDNQTCTNFLALFDIINNLVSTKVLNYNIDLENNQTEYLGFVNIGKQLGINKKKIKKAYIHALNISKSNKNKLINDNIKKLKSNKNKILIVSHEYNIYDDLIGNTILNLLKENDIEIIYSNLFNSSDKYKKLCNGLYWKYSKDSTNAIVESLNYINGIIFLSSFPCGLDSIVNELIIRKISIPYLNIIIDDINQSGGIETRIESFLDIVKNY